MIGFGQAFGLSGVGWEVVDGIEGFFPIKSTSLGVGEIDTLIGSPDAVNSFILSSFITGANPTAQTFYIGNGDEDYALIQNLDINDEGVVLAGNPQDYKFQTLNGNFRISTQEGDLVAIVEGVSNLQVTGTFAEFGIFSLGLLDPSTYKPYFNNRFYLQTYPDVKQAIKKGEFTSGFDQYLQVGQFKGRNVIFNGTGKSDAVTAFGESTYIFGLTVTKADFAQSGFRTRGKGVGQIDILNGNTGSDRFVLGNNQVFYANSQPFYVGKGDADYAQINNFDLKKDWILLAGESEDYIYTPVDGNLKISTQTGDLVALVEGVAELKPYTGYNPVGGTYLLSLENEFFSTYIEPSFFEPIYSVQNPDVIPLVESGQYSSYYDHFLKAGQFEEREDTFFVGTEENDTLYSIGYESVLVGVPVSQAQYQGGLDVVPTNTGTGQIDTFISGAQAETIFVLGNSTVLNETAQSFYIGEGDADYALIKNFHSGDRIFLGSDPLEFTLETVDSNLEISKNGDLVAIVENLATNLVIQGEELVASPLDSYVQGTAGNDTLYATNEQTNIIGVPLSDENLRLVALSTGVGEVDILYDNEEGSATFYLGFATADSSNTLVPFYIGQGDEDYALIKNFNPTVDHSVQIAGQFDDYSIEEVDGNTRISKDGDLIAIAENVILVPDFEEGGFTNLYSSDDEYFVENTQPFFNESIYLAENPDAADAIAADEFTSGYQHFMRVGLLEGRYAYYNGTSGNEDDIYAMGNSYVLGVPVTGFDAATETFTTGTTGMGEVDTLTGTVSANKFVLGSNGQTFYLGNGDTDYAEINNFDALKDEILLAGSYNDYTFSAVGNNLNITKNSDLVAIVNGITEISPDALSFS